jgi:hypothetical protein
LFLFAFLPARPNLDFGGERQKKGERKEKEKGKIRRKRKRGEKKPKFRAPRFPPFSGSMTRTKKNLL